MAHGAKLPSDYDVQKACEKIQLIADTSLQASILHGLAYYKVLPSYYERFVARELRPAYGEAKLQASLTRKCVALLAGSSSAGSVLSEMPRDILHDITQNLLKL